MEIVRMSSDLRLKINVELSQAAYLKFHSVFNLYYTTRIFSIAVFITSSMVIPLRNICEADDIKV
jgi:hypothetical protein